MTDRILDSGNPGDPPPPPPPPGSSTPPPQDPNGDGGGPGVGGTPAPPRRHHTQPKAPRQNIAAWKPEDRPGAYEPAVRASPVGQLAELNQRVGRVAAESTHWSSGARDAGHAGGGGGRFDSFFPPRGFPGGLPLPKPKKLATVDPTFATSKNKLPIGPARVKGYEVTGRLSAAVRATWSVGHGKTEVSLDPGSRAVSFTRGPLSFTDSGGLRRLVRRLESPGHAVQALRRPGVRTTTFTNPLTVDFRLGSKLIGTKTRGVTVTTDVRNEGAGGTVEVDATAKLSRTVPGYGKVSLSYSLDADLTVDKQAKEKVRQKAPAWTPYFIEAGGVLVIAALLLRRVTGIVDGDGG